MIKFNKAKFNTLVGSVSRSTNTIAANIQACLEMGIDNYVNGGNKDTSQLTHLVNKVIEGKVVGQRKLIKYIEAATSVRWAQRSSKGTKYHTFVMVGKTAKYDEDVLSSVWRDYEVISKTQPDVLVSYENVTKALNTLLNKECAIGVQETLNNLKRLVEVDAEIQANSVDAELVAALKVAA